MENKITELKAEVHRLREESELKSGWISLISHNLKEVFGSLFWLTDAVEKETISKDDYFRMLPRIKQDAQKNLQAVEDTSQWLRTQIEGFEPQEKKVLGLDIFSQLKDENQNKLDAKKIDFQYKGDENLYFQTDPNLLSFVLNKLLDNAIKYSHPKESIHFEVNKQFSQVVLSIIDFGTGMAPEQQESVFSFESALYEGTSGEIGTGLGLKITKNFVFLMQGKLEIKSTENKGTKISVFLPQIEK